MGGGGQFYKEMWNFCYYKKLEIIRLNCDENVKFDVENFEQNAKKTICHKKV